MQQELCRAKTKKGKPCKNKAVIDGYCRVHAKAMGLIMDDESVTQEIDSAIDASIDESAVEAPDPSPKSFDMIVTAGANLINALEKAIVHVPNLMDNVFKYTGSRLLMPKFSAMVQDKATEKSLQLLRKWQTDFINLASDPSKMDQLLDHTRRLEGFAGNILAKGGNYLPDPVKMELLKAYEQLRNLRS